MDIGTRRISEVMKEKRMDGGDKRGVESQGGVDNGWNKK